MRRKAAFRNLKQVIWTYLKVTDLVPLTRKEVKAEKFRSKCLKPCEMNPAFGAQGKEEVWIKPLRTALNSSQS